MAVRPAGSRPSYSDPPRRTWNDVYADSTSQAPPWVATAANMCRRESGLCRRARAEEPAQPPMRVRAAEAGRWACPVRSQMGPARVDRSPVDTGDRSDKRRMPSTLTRKQPLSSAGEGSRAGGITRIRYEGGRGPNPGRTHAQPAAQVIPGRAQLLVSRAD
jgi:hypothetical protein